MQIQMDTGMTQLTAPAARFDSTIDKVGRTVFAGGKLASGPGGHLLARAT